MSEAKHKEKKHKSKSKKKKTEADVSSHVSASEEISQVSGSETSKQKLKSTKQPRLSPEQPCGSMHAITSESRRVQRTFELIIEEYMDSVFKLTAEKMEGDMSKTEVTLLTERIINVEKNIEKLEMAEEEAQILRAFGNYIIYQECDNDKLRMKNRRMEDENQWLQAELDKLEEYSKDIAADLNTSTKETLKLQENYCSLSFSDKPADQRHSKYMPAKSASQVIFPVSTRIQHISTLVEQLLEHQKFDAGHSLCKSHLNQLKAKVGKNHIDYASLLCLDGKLYMVEEKLKEAIRCFTEALPAIHKSGNEVSVYCLYNNIAECYCISNSVSHAEKNALKAMALIERCRGKGSLMFVVQLCITGFLSGLSKKYGDSERFLDIAIQQFNSLKAPRSLLLRVRLFSAAVQLCCENTSQAEKTVKEIIDEIHAKMEGRVSDINPSFWMILENPRNQNLEKLKGNAGLVDNYELAIAIKILKFIYKVKGLNKLVSLIEEYISDPDVEASLHAVALLDYDEMNANFFRILTKSEIYEQLISKYLDDRRKAKSKERKK